MESLMPKRASGCHLSLVRFCDSGGAGCHLSLMRFCASGGVGGQLGWRWGWVGGSVQARGVPERSPTRHVSKS